MLALLRVTCTAPGDDEQLLTLSAARTLALDAKPSATTTMTAQTIAALRRLAAISGILTLEALAWFIIRDKRQASRNSHTGRLIRIKQPDDGMSARAGNGGDVLNGPPWQTDDHATAP